MYCCPPGASPNTLRRAEMLTVRLASSTKLSGHTCRMSSSFIRSWPLLRMRAMRISNDFGDNETGLPPHNKRCSRGSQRNLPNSYKTFVSADMTVLGIYLEFLYQPLRTVLMTPPTLLLGPDLPTRRDSSRSGRMPQEVAVRFRKCPAAYLLTDR